MPNKSHMFGTMVQSYPPAHWLHDLPAKSDACAFGGSPIFQTAPKCPKGRPQMLLRGPGVQGQVTRTPVAALHGLAVQEGAGLRTWDRGDAPYFQNHVYAYSHMYISSEEV